MVESSSKQKRDVTLMYSRVGTGRQAELADIRDSRSSKATGEETKEDIIKEAVDEYPKSGVVVEKVSEPEMKPLF